MFTSLRLLWLGSALRSRQPARREAAIRKLGRIQDSRALRPVLAALADPSAAVAVAAQEALKQIGPASAWAIPALREGLGDENEKIRRDAAFALGQMRGAAVPALTERLGDASWQVREAAARGLYWATGYTDVPALAALPALTERFGDEHPGVRQAAVEAVGRMGRAAAPAVAALVQRLSDQHESVREAAALALSCVGPAAAPAVPALMERLVDPAEEVRYGAAWALGHIGPAAAAAVPALAERLADHTPRVVEYAEEALGRIDPDWQRLAAPAIPALAKQLANPNEVGFAGSALRKIGPAAVWVLAEGLAAEDPEIRRSLAIQLGTLGPAAAPAVPALVKVLTDLRAKSPDRPTLNEVLAAKATAQALASIGPAAAPAVLPLVDLFESEYAYVHAQEALPRIDPDWAQKAVPVLVERLTKGDQVTRYRAMVALRWIGPPAAPAVPALVQRLGEEGEQGDWCTPAVALGHIGPAAAPAVPLLVRILAGRLRHDSEMCRRLAWILGAIGPAAAPAVPLLIELLADESSLTRQEAAEALGEIGPAAAAAVSALERLRDDPASDYRIGGAVSAALERIGPGASGSARNAPRPG